MSNEFESKEYKYGFYTDIETEEFPKGLNEDIIRMLSAKKEEPEWLLEYRLKAYRHWLTMKKPEWAKLEIPEIDFNDLYYYSAPKKKEELKSLDEVDPELLETFEKLGMVQEKMEFLGKDQVTVPEYHTLHVLRVGK